jgi:hypothetical protein
LEAVPVIERPCTFCSSCKIIGQCCVIADGHLASLAARGRTGSPQLKLATGEIAKLRWALPPDESHS